jgi:hypothetical protein
MNSAKLKTRQLAAAASLCCAAFGASASTINLGTSNPGWIAEYNEYIGPAFHFPCPVHDCISISSNGRADGQFVQGGTADQFSGSWRAYLEFELPLDAVGVVLDLVIHGADDRGTLFLNDRELITNYLDGALNVTLHLDDASYFNFGGFNTLSVFVVNNPYDSLGDPLPFQFANDSTAYSLSGTVGIGETVPEPATWALVLTCGGWLALVRRRLLESHLARR